MTTITQRTYTPGWDAGARSIAYFSGDGCAYWQVRQAIGIVCGFNSDNQGAGFQEIEHGFYISSGKYSIIEKGLFKTPLTSIPDLP
ncbi:hypothetical protein RZS08_30805, partial [Arthrospira platensis SPKY1]|nr:hypothetical protein [Arthrospira platensis SPKY1]